MRKNLFSPLFHQIALVILLSSCLQWHAIAQIPTFPEAEIVFTYDETTNTYVQKVDTVSLSMIDPLDRGKLIPGKVQYQHSGFFLPDGKVAYRRDLISHTGWYEPWMTPPATVIWMPDAVYYYDITGYLVDQYEYIQDSLNLNDPPESHDAEDFGYHVIPTAPSLDVIQEFNNAGIFVLIGSNGQWSAIEGETTFDFDPANGLIQRTTFQNGLIQSQETEIYKPAGNGKYFALATQNVEHDQWQNNICVRRITTSNFSNHQAQDFRDPGTLREGTSDIALTHGLVPTLLTNPIVDILDIRTPVGYRHLVSAHVMDAIGRVVYSFPKGPNEGVLICQTQSWPAGIYTVALVNQSGEITTIKAIKN